MGAYATIRMPVDLSGGGAPVAQRVVEDFPGTRNVSLDGSGGAIAFELQFPGNLTALVGRLRSSRIEVGETVDVTIPFRACVPEALDPSLVLRRLVEGPEVWDVSFPRGRYVLDAKLSGDRIEATVVPSTSSMHELYDALLSVGILVDEEPTTV